MEPTPPELGAATGSPHGLIVEGREELLYLLGEAAEVEHAACCIYLYAAFTLRAEPGDGLTAAQVPAVAGWKRAINQIALQEMIHLALVNNLLAALGGAPRLGRHNLPQRSPYAPEIRLTLAPFSEQTLRRFLYIERPEGMDISSIAGELDHDRPAPPVPTGRWCCRRRRPSPASGSCTTGSSEGCAAWSTATGRSGCSSARPTRRRRRGTFAFPTACQS
jgi:hypothetical protein